MAEEDEDEGGGGGGRARATATDAAAGAARGAALTNAVASMDGAPGTKPHGGGADMWIRSPRFR